MIGSTIIKSTMMGSSTMGFTTMGFSTIGFSTMGFTTIGATMMGSTTIIVILRDQTHSSDASIRRIYQTHLSDASPLGTTVSRPHRPRHPSPAADPQTSLAPSLTRTR
ncbi:hypothetical protein PROH_01860 [Prochlorothrix hollandica PCC 9006 = CALU 1027]|uniref:Uncharacterized protein n=1 Tax=Prochlorothrix hollandica PCC 9006 = CALU 1027 TaxID=317619 RepID=A0A0M2Q3I8_PROHO|nr:hypothetical protein PROH_01860 [Prochlorothrix hollandica PCC 9006 = CALU 1027]